MTLHIIFDTPLDHRLPELWVDTHDEKYLTPKITGHLKRHWTDWAGYIVHLKPTGDRGTLMNEGGTYSLFTVTKLPYELNLREDWDTGIEHPNEMLWWPDTDPKSAVENGFYDIQGVGLTTALAGSDGAPWPASFLTLGHNVTRDQMTAAAVGYMSAAHDFADITRYPDDETDVPPADPEPELHRRWTVFLRHPHKDFPCGCEWEGTWRVEDVPEDTEGAVAVTTMRHPAYRTGVAL